ncbi:glycosyltransferase family 4 protein [Marinactinospora rubrisoli]|uniref:Glycosyltransferase family 4 protein n=1 Tax=Marinactinospora rubrisoli TaxID=2715399 RepID=A0ABW2KHK6_9ACTN
MSEVVVVFGGYGAGLAGAERMAWRTAQHLARRGHAVAVATDSRRPPFLDDAPPRLLRTETELRRYAEHHRPDVVHAFDLARPAHVAAALRLARATGARLALTPATTPELWPDPGVGRRACAAADVVFALTPTEAAALRTYGAAGTALRTLPQAPDLAGRPDPAGFRARHGITGPTVLFVGRRTVGKGYPRLVAAAPQVWRRVRDAEFVFAGPPGDGASAGLPGPPGDPRVHDLGLADDRTKHDAVAACDVLCLPTSADVFPLVFAEAWASGRPVVSGAFPGVHDVVRDGVDGLVVPPRTGDVADALVRLLTDPGLRRALGEAGRRRAAREFTWDRVAAACEAGYRTGAAAPPATASAGAPNRAGQPMLREGSTGPH